MKIYEIANPSDAYTLEAEDFLVAAVAVAMLGNGAYGIPGSPILWGWDAWLKERIPQGLDAYITANREAIATVLDSVMIGSEADRVLYQKTLSLIESPERREEFRQLRHDTHRSSMNNIGTRAWALAKRMRGAAVTVPKDGSIILTS